MMAASMKKTLANTEILDEIHNEATRRIAGLPGVKEAYMRKGTSRSRGENYLVLYDETGRIIGRLTVKDGVVVAASADRPDIEAVLRDYVGAEITTARSNHDDRDRNGLPYADCWM